MKLSDLSEASPYWSLSGLHLGLAWRGSLQHTQFLSELDTSTPIALDQFLTPKISDDQVLVTSTTVTFSLLKNFVPVSSTKFSKKINKKTKYKTFTKILLLFFSLVLRRLPVYKNSETTFP